MLAAAKEPVDGPLLVYRQVVLVEPRGEVAADRLSWLLAVVRAEAVGDELQILLQVFPGPNHTDKLHDPVGGVVPDAPIRSEQRDDAVVIGLEGLVLAGVETLVAAMGVDQPRLVEAVPAHHAADGVGEQPLDVFFPVGPIEGDLLIGDFGREFVLQAVGFNEEAVVLLFELLHASESSKAIGIGGFLGLLDSGDNLPPYRNGLKVPRSLEVIPIASRQSSQSSHHQIQSRANI